MNQTHRNYYKEAKRKRSRRDKIICGFNSIRYLVTETAMLKIVRIRYAHLYKDSKNEPLISVYTPTYNRGQLLIERAVSSVLAQTYKNFELIIIGDHCTDNTEELILKIDDARIRFYNLPERKKRYPSTAENHWLAGPVAAANKALELIRGKWIARIDDDDIWTPDHLESLLDCAQKGDYEFVSASYISERRGERIVVAAKDQDPKIGGTQTWLYRSYLRFFKYNINCWRKTWNRVNDADLRDRMWRTGVRMGVLDKVVGYVLPRPGEVTVGKNAYIIKRDEKENHFKFQD